MLLSSYIPRPIRESDESALGRAQTYQHQFYSFKKSEVDQHHDTETGDRDSKDDDNQGAAYILNLTRILSTLNPVLDLPKQEEKHLNLGTLLW